MNTRRAVIDVGTNSVKVLVADVTPQEITPVHEDSDQTRLGRGFYDTHLLQAEAIRQTATAVAAFAEKARELGAESVRVIATSAARDAKNAAELIAALEAASGVRLEIISGAQEAEWAYRGVLTQPDLAESALLLLDIGGGSTEFILGDRGHTLFQESFQLGTVRLLEKCPCSDPPTAEERARTTAHVQHFLRTTVRPRLQPFLAQCAGHSLQLVGTGGTSTLLARMQNAMDDYDRDRIEATRLTLAQVEALTDRLWSLPLAQRQQIIGLPPKRADVMLMGALIFAVLMQEFSLPTLRPTTRGLRFAALMEK